MKTPPWLLGFTLIFWGWQTGLLVFAVIMAVILEGARFVKFRWDFSLAELKRVSDVCSVILIGIIIYRFTAYSLTDINFLPLQWFPIVLFPLLTAQFYSTEGKIDIRALLLTLRRKQKTAQKKAPTAINLSYPYFAVCFFAAGAANVRASRFYLGLLLLSAWAFWSVRCKRYSAVVWASVFIISAVMGYAGQIQLHHLQRYLEQNETLLRWFGALSQDTDPYQSMTAIGDIGTVKLSNRVAFRVKSDTRSQTPLLFREAIYNTYKSSKWYAARSKFRPIQSETDGTTWNIQPDSKGYRQITVSSYLKDGKGILTLPTGTFQIKDLPVLRLSSNQYGTLKVEEGPRVITYQGAFSPYHSVDSPPEENDLAVPPEELAVLRGFIEDLDLSSTLAPNEILQKVHTFFQQNFSYSLELRRQAQNTTPLSDFLNNVRSGHCEYFAMATVLLLRTAGIPARYAAGYSVDGLEKEGEWTVVRGRDAHAWALVYLNGAWYDFDTTPPVWSQIEDDAASPFERLSDLWSQWMFAFTEWRQRERDDTISGYLIWLLIPLLLVLGWRLYSKRRIQHVTQDQQENTEINHYPGTDSEFYLIEKRLHELGYVRHPWEPLSQWIHRIETQSSPSPLPSLVSILVLHYRYRFDPEGITPTEKAALKSSVQSWLEEE